MKHLIRLLPVAAMAMLLVSCSKKTAESITATSTTTTPASQSDMEYIVSKVNGNRNTAEQMTCRMSMDLAAGKQKISVGGNLKMKRDDVIQLSLQVFGFVEAGRMELTKDYFLNLNRIGKQYVKASYKDVPFFKENGINFYTFQSLMWNELFVPGKSNKEVPTEIDYTKSVDGSNVKMTYAAKQYMLNFLATAATGVLQQTSIVPATNNGKLEWKYTSWTRLGNGYFPDKMQIGAKIGATDINIAFELSRVRENEKWTETRTDIDKKKLKQVSLQTAFAQILSLTN